MLQLIGWLGCIYLLVKGFEFLSNAGYRRADGGLKSSAAIAIAIAWLGAIVMFFAITVQGMAVPGMSATPLTASDAETEYPERSAAWHECVTAAKDAVEASACRDVK